MIKRLAKNKVAVIAVSLAAAGLVVGALYIKSSQKPKEAPKNPIQNEHINLDEDATNPSSPQTPAGQPNSTNPSSPTSPTPSSTLPKPTGQLLNKHSVQLSSGDPMTNPDLLSTCQAVSGARCDIRLTGPANTVKTLGEKNIDEQGAIWEWNAKTIGLTTGRWKVEAIASKDGQTSTSSPDYLEVRP